MSGNMFGSGSLWSRLVNSLHLFFHYIYRLGFRRTFGSLVRYWTYKGEVHVEDIDERLGIETSEVVIPSRAGLEGELEERAVLYFPTHSGDFREMMDYLVETDFDFSKYTFVDLGCGKARAMLLAAEKPFQSIMGVELSEDLVTVARENITKAKEVMGFKGSMEVRQGDARKLEWPLKPLVVYFYQPFDSVIMEGVLDGLFQSLKDQPRDMMLLYNQPLNQERYPESLLQKDNFFSKSHGTDKGKTPYSGGWSVYHSVGASTSVSSSS